MGGLQSMTGFARAQGQAECGAAGGRWAWELRSVNAKGLDVRLRMPPGLEAIESEARRRIQSAFARGNIQASLQFDPDENNAAPVVNAAPVKSSASKQPAPAKVRAKSPRSAAVFEVSKWSKKAKNTAIAVVGSVVALLVVYAIPTGGSEPISNDPPASTRAADDTVAVDETVAAAAATTMAQN